MAQRPKRATSADVAARAGVSRTTVSFVLNGRADAGIPGDTWRRVEDAARELGYHPHGAARALAGGASHTIGLVLRQSPDQVSVDALLAETLWGIGSEAHLGGYRVLVEPLSPGDGHYSDLVSSQRVDGLIVSGPRTDDAELVALVEQGFPIIVQGSLPSVAVPSVDVDNRAGARTAVDHLLELGHRRIACITNAPLAYTAAADRLAGYRDALDAASVAYAPELVVEGAFDAASGWTAMGELLRAGTGRDGRVRRQRHRRVRRAAGGPRGGPPRPGGHLGRGLRRHPARAALRPAAHDDPPAGARPRGRRRSGTGGTTRRTRRDGTDAAPHGARRP